MLRKITPHIRGKPLDTSARRILRWPKWTAPSPGGGVCTTPPLSFWVVRAQVKGGIRGPDPPD